MWLVQIMKKEGNKTTTTTNTSYSIPTSFVGTAYPWVYVKDVGMEYDVFVVRSCSLVPFLFHNLHQPHPYITLNFEEMFFLLVPLIFFVHLGVAVPAHTGKSCPVGGQER